jgi:hypothetical protein
MEQEVVPNKVEEPKSEPVTQEELQALQEKINQLEASKERILVESKDHASRYKKLRGEVENKEKARLEEQENWKELLELEKNNSFEQAERLKNLQRTSLKQALNFEVARYAGSAHDINDVIAALPVDMISVDENTMQVSGAKEAVEFLVKEKSYLFKSNDTPRMVNNRPAIGDVNKPAEVSQDDLLQAAIKQIAIKK